MVGAFAMSSMSGNGEVACRIPCRNLKCPSEVKSWNIHLKPGDLEGFCSYIVQNFIKFLQEMIALSMIPFGPAEVM